VLFDFTIIVVENAALFADNTCHYVCKNAKLVEITYFNTEFESFYNLVFVQFEDKGYSFHRVAEELRKIIIEMLVEENQVFVKVVVQSI